MVSQADVAREFSDLDDWVWKQIGIRKYAMGRARVRQSVHFVVRNWPTSSFGWGHDNETTCRQLAQLAEDHLRPRFAKGESKYGFVIWSMILSAVLSQIVAALLKWWLESDRNQVSMSTMKVLRQGEV
jgi:alpha-beta hydrolase superfamily lysophospholipase